MAPPKRFQVTDHTGWTHIVKGNQNRIKALHTVPMRCEPAEFADGLTFDMVLEQHKKCMRRWRESECLNALERIISGQVLTSENLRITRCICLGLGSLTRNDECGERSRYQLTTLISVLEILGEKHKIDEVFIQDPTFNHLDESLLNSLGYTVLKTPSALGKMTAETFLFDPYLEWDVTAKAFAVAQPSFRIGNNLLFDDNWVKCCTESEGELLQQFLHTRSLILMPKFNSIWLHTAAIYWIPSPNSPVQHPSPEPVQIVRNAKPAPAPGKADSSASKTGDVPALG